jgi:hypothetical protein
MWEQYRKSFIGMQVTILLFTAASYLAMYHAVMPALLFFTTLQIGGVAGAFWATKLKKRNQLGAS